MNVSRSSGPGAAGRTEREARSGSCVDDGAALIANLLPPEGISSSNAFRWLDIDQRPRLVLDHADRIVWSNAAARRMLRPPRPVVIEGDRLEMADKAVEATARRLIHEADGQVRRMSLGGGDSEQLSLVLNAWAAGTGSHRQVFIRINLLEATLGVEESGLAEAYGLTPAEAVVLDCLLSLEPPGEIARRQGLSINTVRTHVRRIYAKMGVSTQPQLINLGMVFCSG